MFAPGATVERYRVESELGHGANGTVFRAIHLQLGTPVALKVLTEASPAGRARLLREAQLQARLRHPNLVSVTDVFEHEAGLVMVLEFVDGPNLEERLSEGVLPWPEVVDLGRGILAGVAVAHAAGVLHRDLKPSNVLLSGGTFPKVADFGIAKPSDPAAPGLTAPGHAIGTAGYMPPEQWADAASADARADLFAIGVVLYECLTGRRPFEGSDLVEIMQATVAGDHPSIRSICPECPSAVAAVIERALQPHPDDRWQDAHEFDAALSAALRSRRSRRFGAWFAGAATLAVVVGALAAGRSDHRVPVVAAVEKTPVKAALATPAVEVEEEPGETILLGDTAPPPTTPPRHHPTVAPDTSGPCSGEAGQIIGWWWAGHRLLPLPGTTVKVRRDTPVRTMPPNAENGWSTQSQVRCVLQKGERVRVHKEAQVVEGDRWVALYGEDLVVAVSPPPKAE